MIIIYTNCQGGVIKRFLKKYYEKNNKDIEINYYPNYYQDNINYELLKNCTVFIYHKKYNKNSNIVNIILEKIPKTCHKISIPYIFIDGIACLCHAPLSVKYNYGKIYGDVIIIGLINKKYSKEQIISMFLNGQIDFKLDERLKNSLAELKKRDQYTDIKVYEFIKKNYKSKKMFISNNHPTTIVFKYIYYQILNILRLPNNFIIPFNNENPGLSVPGYVLSLHDIKKLDLSYNYSNDWKEVGYKLINIIYNTHKKKDL
jgi:hypothetical protein